MTENMFANRALEYADHKHPWINHQKILKAISEDWPIYCNPEEYVEFLAEDFKDIRDLDEYYREELWTER